MISEPFPTGMPRGAPSEGVPGHECTVRSKCDSIRPRAIRTHSGLAKGCRTTTQAVPHAPGGDSKSRRAAFYGPRSWARRGAAGGSAGLRAGPIRGTSANLQLTVTGSVRADSGLRGTCAGWAKVGPKPRRHREPQTRECVSHVPRGRDRPPVHAQHATTAARVVRCPFVRNTLHGVIFLMQCLD